MRSDNALSSFRRSATRLRERLVLFPLLALLFAAAGCTTVGMHDHQSLAAVDFGEREELRICVLADEGITEQDARALIAKVGEEFSAFGLNVTVPWVKRWERPAFLMQGIVEDVWRRPLEAPCDRLVALVGRNLGDFLWGLSGIEVLGAVDTPTHSRGYVIAQRLSLNQLFSSPTDTAIHESYHLLGCEHDASLSDCYGRIRELKQTARTNRQAGKDFFPAVSWKGNAITSRPQVNQMLNHAIALSQLTRRSDANQ